MLKTHRKGKIFENLGNYRKFKIIFNKGRWLRAIVGHNKLLEKALTDEEHTKHKQNCLQIWGKNFQNNKIYCLVIDNFQTTW